MRSGQQHIRRDSFNPRTVYFEAPKTRSLPNGELVLCFGLEKKLTSYHYKTQAVVNPSGTLRNSSPPPTPCNLRRTLFQSGRKKHTDTQSINGSRPLQPGRSEGLTSSSSAPSPSDRAPFHAPASGPEQPCRSRPLALSLELRLVPSHRLRLPRRSSRLQLSPTERLFGSRQGAAAAAVWVSFCAGHRVSE